MRFISASKIHIIFLISTMLIALSHTSCKDDEKYTVPAVLVSLQLNLNTQLAAMGVGESAVIIPDEYEFGWIYFQNNAKSYTGQKVYGTGLVIYRSDIEAFNVFDRTCPNPLDNYCPVELTDALLSVKCSCCGSVFEVVYSGACQSGPAGRSLRDYNASAEGGFLYLYN